MYFQFWDFDHSLDFVLLYWFLKYLLGAIKTIIIILLYIITAMKITSKNARKTLRFVTAKEQVFSFRAVSFFPLFLFIYLFIFIFSDRRVLMIIVTFFTCILKYCVRCRSNLFSG